MVDRYLQWAATTGASFVPAWNNADVVIVALVLFAACFLASAFSGRNWLFDVAFLALVVGGILVPWPAMVVLSIVAVILAVVFSFLHRALAPAQSARIGEEADRIAKPRTADFVRDLLDSTPGSMPEDAARRLPQESPGDGAGRERRRPDGKE